MGELAELMVTKDTHLPPVYKNDCFEAVNTVRMLKTLGEPDFRAGKKIFILFRL